MLDKITTENKKVMLASPDEKVRQQVGIPEGHIPLYALSIGYGNESLDERASRKEGAITFIK